MRATRSVFTLAILIVSIQVFSVWAFAGQGTLDTSFGINGFKDTPLQTRRLLLIQLFRETRFGSPASRLLPPEIMLSSDDSV